MGGLQEYERGLCDCGFHESIRDPDAHAFDIKKDRCAVCAARDRYTRMQSEADEKWRKKHTEADRKDPADGRKARMVYEGPVPEAGSNTASND